MTVDDIDPQTATAVGMLAAVRESQVETLADCEEILAVAHAFAQGRGEWERARLDAELRPVREDMESARRWIAEIDMLGTSDEGIAAELLRRFRDDPFIRAATMRASTNQAPRHR